MHKFVLAALLLAGCASAPVVAPAPEPAHFTAGIVFHTCGLVTAAELVTSDGRLLYLSEEHANPDDFADAIDAENALGNDAVDVEVNPHCMKS